MGSEQRITESSMDLAPSPTGQELALSPQKTPDVGESELKGQKSSLNRSGTLGMMVKAFTVSVPKRAGLQGQPVLKGEAAARAFASCALAASLRRKIGSRTLELLDLGGRRPGAGAADGDGGAANGDGGAGVAGSPGAADGLGLLPGCLSHLRARYSLYLFRAAHLILTAVIFYHHFFIKLTEKEKAVPEGAPNWTWKRFVPAVEFGTMHAILFQLALIPLTMCRFSLAFLSTTPLSFVIPFEHAVDFHIFLGYVFGIFMVLTVTLFLTFFGKVCVDFQAGRDPADTCKNFTSEIMLTGYAILFCTLVVLLSSFFRRKLKFEWFYLIHHMALIMMLLAVLHTMDDEFRAGTKTGRNRSQAFKWFTTSLVVYFGDRLWQHLSAKRDVPITSLAVARDGSVLILKLKKPSNFKFAAGQHAFIQIPAIDLTYHPFSIGSAPSSSELTFIMEIQKPGSWTERLARMSKEKVALEGVKVNVMGGFGSPVAGKLHYSEILAIGTGTGVVPMISLMLEHAHRLHFVQKSALQDAADANLGRKKPLPLGMCLLQMMARWKSVQSQGLKSPYMRRVASRARWMQLRDVLGLVASFWLLFELYLLATTLSLAGLPEKAPAVASQAQQLRIGTLVTLSIYTGLRIIMWATPKEFQSTHLAKMAASFDALLLVLTALLLAFWWEDELVWLRPTLGQQALRSVLSLWRIIMLWATSPARHQFWNMAMASKLVGVRKFTLVWSCPSAHLVAGYLQVFEGVLSALARELDCTPEALQSCIEIKVYCTEKNEERLRQLRDGVEASARGRSFVRFSRADLKSLVEGAMERELMHGLNGGGASHTLVTFCGSRKVAALLRGRVEVANGVADSLGLSQHKMSFREEFYGVGK